MRCYMPPPALADAAVISIWRALILPLRQIYCLPTVIFRFRRLLLHFDAAPLPFAALSDIRRLPAVFLKGLIFSAKMPPYSHYACYTPCLYYLRKRHIIRRHAFLLPLLLAPFIFIFISSRYFIYVSVLFVSRYWLLYFRYSFAVPLFSCRYLRADVI